MSKSEKSDRVVVGAIAGAHGVRGDLRVKSFTAEPGACFNYGPLTDADGNILFEVKSRRVAKNHYIVVPETPRQKEEWDGLKGSLLYVPRAVLPETDDDEYYIADLVGLDAYAGGDERIGTVKAVQDFGAGDIVEIAPLEGSKTWLVPFTKEVVSAVDIKAGRIIIASLEMWTSEDEPKQNG